MATSTVDDLFFREVVAGYVKAPRFVRRDWLASMVEEELADPACRFVLITAEPGAGKSSFLAQLASDDAGSPVFFVRRDQRTSLGETGARSFLLRTGLQLAARRPELFDLDQVRIEVEQRIGNVAAGGDVVGAEIKRIRASPFSQKVLRVVQDVRQAGGTVAGLRVDEWVTDARLLDVDDLQELARIAPAERIVLLVDALDELRSSDTERDLLEWLTTCPPLPQNVRVVLTSRPRRDRLESFVERRKDSVRCLEIRSADRRVQEDVRTYAAALLEPQEIAAALKATGRTGEAFVTELTARADGNLGYVGALGRACDRARADAEHQPLIERLLALEHLPEDTRGLFTFFVHLIRSGPGSKHVRVTDPATGEARLVEAWPEIYFPVLSSLAVAQQPVTVDELHALTGTVAGRHQLADAVGWLAQFLDQIGDTYRLYHASFAEFLTSDETRQSPETSDLWVDAVAEHRRIGRVLDRAGGLASIWSDTPDPHEQGRRRYARLHYVAHLFQGQDWGRLAEVVDDGGYGRGKLHSDPSTYLYSRDLDLAIRTLTLPTADVEARLARLERLWRWKLLRTTLSSYADRLPPSAYRALALAGQHREAIDLAELMPAPSDNAVALAAVARGRGAVPGAEADAAMILLRALEAAGRIDDPASRIAVLRRVLDGTAPLAAAGSEEAAAMRAVASTVAREPADALARTESLASVGAWFAAAGRSAETFEVRTVLSAEAERAQDPRVLNAAAVAYCRLALETGDLEAAKAVVHYVPYFLDRLEVGASILFRETRGGAAAAAEETRTWLRRFAADAPSGRPRALADAAVARAFFAVGDSVTAAVLLDDALEQPAASETQHEHAETLRELASALREVGDATRYEAVARALVDYALTNLAEPSRDRQLLTASLKAISAAQCLAELDEPERALDVANALRSHERPGVLLAVARSFVRRGKLERALKVVDAIRSSYATSIARLSLGANEEYNEADSVLVTVVVALAGAHRWDDALESAGRIGDPRARFDALALIACAELEDGRAAEARAVLAGIIREARLGNVASDRDGAWWSVGQLLVRNAQWPRARTVARAIAEPNRRAALQSRIVEAQLAAGDPVGALETTAAIDSAAARAEAQLATLRKARTGGAAPGDLGGVGAGLSALAEAHASARGEDDLVHRAEVLRTIAIAFSELGAAGAADARRTLLEAIDALNHAPRFRFVPTPWGATAVACATIGDWGLASRIATGLVDHDPLDGANALCDLAIFAGQRDELDRAEKLLTQARAAAPRIGIPPIRASILVRLATAYAAMGRLDPARRAELIPVENDDARVRLAIALWDAGRIEDAVREIDGLVGVDEAGVSMLVDRLLAAGDIARAHNLAGRVYAPGKRASQLAAVARALTRAGRAAEGREVARSIVELARAAPHDPKMLDAAASALAEVGDVQEACGVVENAWLAASTRRALLDVLELADAVVARRPSIAVAIADSVEWVERVVAAE